MPLALDVTNPASIAAVVGVHVGWVDTAMAARTTDAKLDPALLVSKVFDTSLARLPSASRLRNGVLTGDLRSQRGRSEREAPAGRRLGRSPTRTRAGAWPLLRPRRRES